ncbi:MAG: hypothetical protein KAT65_13650 [Methanophagales archaeon]|nr:hypothetical protein [Methanophagales archaeon]
MIYPWHLGECFTSTGLQYVDEVDWKLEPFFRNKRNIHHFNPAKPGFLKNTPMACTCCKGLPEYHCLYEGNVHGTIVVSCLYTLYKSKNLPDFNQGQSSGSVEAGCSQRWMWRLKKVRFRTEAMAKRFKLYYHRNRMLTKRGK